MQSILGHERVLHFFEQARAHDRLSHAYCFVGPAHVGKRAVAETLAASLLEISREKVVSHPDVVVIEPPVDAKTGKQKKDISIEQLRSCHSFLSTFSLLGGYKVAIIDQAERMSLSAANALLKSLEEPRSKTVLILITPDEQQLPQTILSRCQQISFAPVETTVIEQALRETGAANAQEMASAARGLPGLAMQWAADPEQFTQHQQEVARFTQMIGQPFYKKIEAVESLFGDKTDHVAARNRLHEILGLWLVLVRDAVRDGSLERSQAVSLYRQLTQARTLLFANIHPRLLVEHVMLALP